MGKQTVEPVSEVGLSCPKLKFTTARMDCLPFIASWAEVDLTRADAPVK